MGVKTKITLNDLYEVFDVKSLQETTNGVSHTVYILNQNYILKLYENVDEKYVDEEIKLLNLCKDLSVPKIEKELFIKQKRALIFKKSEGVSLNRVKTNHLKEIASFLKKLHKTTKNKKHKKANVFDKSFLKILVEKSQNDFFKKEFDSIKIELKNDGIIHGDLFLDNAVFCDDKLSCVFDFSDACEGDFIFDLAVVALSWCEEKTQVEKLINYYDENILLEEFILYMRYASLYYCVTRFLDNRDYDNILFQNKFKDLIG